MANLYKNEATGKLSAALTPTGLTATLQAGQGSLFPVPTTTDSFYAVLFNASNFEIVQVTGNTSDTLTIVRAQQGTTAGTFNIGDTIEQRVTAADLQNFMQSPAGAPPMRLGRTATTTTLSATTGTLTAPCAGLAVARMRFEFAGGTPTAFSAAGITASLAAPTMLPGVAVNNAIYGWDATATLKMTSGQQSTFTASVTSSAALYMTLWIEVIFIPLG